MTVVCIGTHTKKNESEKQGLTLFALSPTPCECCRQRQKRYHPLLVVVKADVRLNWHFDLVKPKKCPTTFLLILLCVERAVFWDYMYIS